MSRRANTIARAACWAAATLLVALSARMLAYALQPDLSSDGRTLAAVTGGPSLWAVAAAALALAVSTAVTVTWLVSLAVNERQKLEPNAVTRSATISAGAIAVSAGLLFAASSLTFALVESFIHWRSGLGWHGIHCLIGPVHRDAIPLLAGLSLVAAAILRAGSHLLAWMRRVIRQLTTKTRSARASTALRRPDLLSHPRCLIDAAQLGARGPPSSRSRPAGGDRRPLTERKGTRFR